MLKISFEFDETTKSIRNLKCEVLNKEQVNSNGKPIVEVGDNKLIISPEALSLLGAVPGDRISINYTQKSNEVTIPLIGKSEIFADREAGNKLTKSNTVSFKGKQRTLLLEYGSIFIMEKSNTPGMFYLKTSTDDNSTELSSPELVPEIDITEEEFDKLDNIDNLPF